MSLPWPARLVLAMTLLSQASFTSMPGSDRLWSGGMVTVDCVADDVWVPAVCASLRAASPVSAGATVWTTTNRGPNKDNSGQRALSSDFIALR
jgi:hypothetical protein